MFYRFVIIAAKLVYFFDTAKKPGTTWNYPFTYCMLSPIILFLHYQSERSDDH